MHGLFLSMIGWVTAAACLGFAISAVFAGKLRLARHRFLIPYVVLVAVFVWLFARSAGLDVGALLARQWWWGVAAGVLVSFFVARNVRSQPSSQSAVGAQLAADLTWAGLIYGLTDALLLNVMPVAAIWMGTAQYSWAQTGWGKLAVGAMALLASLLVALAYHLGYSEYRNKNIKMPLIGNTIITLAFLLSGSPLGSIVSHAVMHIAAVLHGPETTSQLPPHYQTKLAHK